MIHTDDGAAKCTSVDFRLQSTQPEPTSALNCAYRVCELGTVPCVEGVKRKRLALCSWRIEHNNGQDEALFKWGTLWPLLSVWPRPGDSELWCRPSPLAGRWRLLDF